MNGMKLKGRHGTRLLMALATLPLAISQAYAAEYWLQAGKTVVAMPGAASVAMWGYSQCTDATFASCGAVTVPGPALSVPAGDLTGLKVHLKNTLSEPTSLVIPGQNNVMTPVWFEPASPATTYLGSRPAGNLTARVRSFTNEAAPGGTADYTWTGIKPGTYLYESGTHPQVQVQMGLYGALTSNAVEATATTLAQAYAGVAYDSQVTMLYSEIDPALHAAVAGGTYGTAVTSTFDYKPKYFLINGQPYTAGAAPLATISGGKKTLLRFINAGLKSHVPMLNGAHMQMIAEDGNPYPYMTRQQYSVLLPAAKTIDGLITPSNAGPGNLNLAILDRRLDVTNAGVPDGGMIAFLAVTAGPAAPVITSSATTTGAVGSKYSYQVVATDPNPGDTLTYSLDAASLAYGMTISATTGLVNWTPTIAGSYAVTVKVTDQTGLFATQAYSLVISSANQPPVISSTPATTTSRNVAYTYAVIATDPNTGDTLTYSLDAVSLTNGMTISATGVVSWLPQVIGNYAVTVTVKDQLGALATQLFTLAVVNDAPVANNDGTYNMVEGSTLSVAAPGVLANDTDKNHDALTAVNYTAPVTGTLTGQANGSFTYAAPVGTSGVKTFTYQANDGLVSSNAATVTINVQANKPPTTVNDSYNVTRRTSSNSGSFPVKLAVLANDSDPDTALDPNNKINPATVVISTGPNKGGTVTANADGTLSYSPKLNFTGTETFQYKVKDTLGALSAAATVYANVQ